MLKGSNRDSLQLDATNDPSDSNCFHRVKEAVNCSMLLLLL